MSYFDIIKEIHDLQHFRDIKCAGCGDQCRVHVLQIYYRCDKCGQKAKVRGLISLGAEVPDVVDAVLEWMGTGPGFDATMRRYTEIQEHCAGEDR